MSGVEIDWAYAYNYISYKLSRTYITLIVVV